MLDPKANKADQITAINTQTMLIGLLLEFASGDETALDKAVTIFSRVAGNAIENAVAKVKADAATPVFAIEAATPDSDICKCKMAVKDKNSVTHLCQLCGKNAHANYYVFDFTDEGKALIAGKSPVLDNWHAPDVDSPGQAVRQAQVTSSGESVAHVHQLPDFSAWPVTPDEYDDGQN